jgi:SAM-dependent methyltransferase
LLSFAMVFAKHQFYSRWFVARLLAVALGAAGYAIYDSSITHAIQISVPLFCSALFVACFFCHGELVQRKPAVRYLTSFYLTIALGGALGAVCVGLLAPHILSGIFELSIVLLLTAILATVVLWRDGWSARIFWACVTISMGAVLVFNVRTMREGTVAMMRNFYGALRIQEFKTGLKLPYRSLVHGTIEHGAQYLSFPENRNPTTYYGRRSGAGLALRFCCDGPKRVGVIGLGAGTLAAYGKPGDSFRFYEINPQVVSVANGWFTFLKQSPAKIEIILGDARLSLESEPSQLFDVLAVDAFSGDAIPVHLLTKEAFVVYFRHLKPGGVLAVHTSNTYLRLAPVVKMLAEDADYASRLISSDEDVTMMVSAADWVLVTRNQEFLNKQETFVGSENIVVPPHLRLWTDDYNNLYEILRPMSYVTHPSDGE